LTVVAALAPEMRMGPGVGSLLTQGTHPTASLRSRMQDCQGDGTMLYRNRNWQPSGRLRAVVPTLIQGIEFLEKQCETAIKLLEEEKRNCKAGGAEILKRHGEISVVVKSVIDRFA
jgi:hypothetical protein